MRPVNVLPHASAAASAGCRSNGIADVSAPVLPGNTRRRTRAREVAVFCLALALSGACSFGEVIEPPDLAITVTAQPASALVGDSVVVRFSATGPSLSSVLLAYGDGETELVGTSGASTANGTRRHAYATAGTFEISAAATSAEEQTVTARTTVVIRVAASADAARREASPAPRHAP